MTLRLRRAWNAIRRRFPAARGLSGCYRCGGAWCYVEHHTTQYAAKTGCFPLCERCWSQLTPSERWPYYVRLVELWESTCSSHEDWMSIQRARAQIRRAVDAGL